MTTVYLKPHKEESLLRFHPWVFSGAIRSIQLDADYPHAQPQEGEVVQVLDSKGQILGVGHYQIGSIAVRILAFGVGELPADFWQERIRAAYQVRCALGLTPLLASSPDNLIASSPINNSYRLVHGEGDFLPGLIVDVYADTAVIQAHSIGMHCHRQEIAEAIAQIVPQVDKVYYKSDDTLPHKAPIQGERVGYLIGAEKADFNGDFWAKENGLDFRIDWLRGQKTGFFIDQRIHRQIKSPGRGKLDKILLRQLLPARIIKTNLTITGRTANSIHDTNHLYGIIQGQQLHFHRTASGGLQEQIIIRQPLQFGHFTKTVFHFRLHIACQKVHTILPVYLGQ